MEALKVVFLLVFVAITALTSVVVLLANINYFGPEVMQSDFAKWGIVAVIGAIVSTTVLAFKWMVISKAVIMIVFDPSSHHTSRKSTRVFECLYETSDTRGNKIDEGRVRVVRDKTSGCWKCFIPISPKMQYEHVTTMRLNDNKGKEVVTVTDYILQHTLEV